MMNLTDDEVKDAMQAITHTLLHPPQYFPKSALISLYNKMAKHLGKSEMNVEWIDNIRTRSIID